MRLKLETPVKLRIMDHNDGDIVKLQGILKYKDSTIEQTMRQLQKNPFYYRRYGEPWVNTRLDELRKELYKTLLFQDEQGYFTLPGLREKIEGGYGHVHFTNEVTYPEFKLIPWKKKPPYEPLPYQEEAIAKFLANSHSHVEIATGLGKTFVAILLAKLTGLPTIISTPSANIAKQIHTECTEYFGKQVVGLFGAGRKDIGKHILVCVGKSLSMVEGEQIEEFKKYQVLISDESHTLPAAQFEYFCHTVVGHCPYRWFMSATQERNDGKDLLLEGIIGHRVYEMTIQEGIAKGYLAKLSTLVFDVESTSTVATPNSVQMNQAHVYDNQQIVKIIQSLVSNAMDNKMPVLILID